MPLYDILNEFQKGLSHMAVVVRNLNKPGDQPTEKKVPDNTVEEVRVMVDGGLGEVEEALKRKRSMHKWKSFPHSNQSMRGMKTKKWNRDIYSDILEFDDKPLPKPAEEEEAVGIITLEDVIEELLQEEIYDETDHHVEDS